MRKNCKDKEVGLTRRQALTGAAATLGFGLADGRSLSAQGRLDEERLAATLPGPNVCILTPEAVQGPFYFDPNLVRADITEARRGAPLALTLQVAFVEDCVRLKGARVDLWHADGQGMYSGYRGQGDDGISTRGQTFLRGTQFTGTDGQVRFATIYPGWYPGRTPHIHFKVFVDSRNVITGQLYFPDPITERVYATTLPYRERKEKRDTFNGDDFIFARQGGPETVVNLTEKDSSYLANLVIGIERNR